MPGTRRRAAQWLISVSRDGLHAADNEQCQLVDSFQNIFTRLGHCATTRNKGLWGNSSLSPRIRHAALAAPARTAWFSTAVSPWGSASRPKPEPPRDSRPGSLARRPRSGSADRTGNTAGRWHLRNTFCGLISPRTPRRHTVSAASPNRPGATPKAEQAAATPGGCCHQPTHPAGHTPECPGPRTVVIQYRRQAVLEQPIDTVCHLNIEIQEARLRTPHTHLTTDEKSACTVTHGPIY